MGSNDDGKRDDRQPGASDRGGQGREQRQQGGDTARQQGSSNYGGRKRDVGGGSMSPQGEHNRDPNRLNPNDED